MDEGEEDRDDNNFQARLNRLRGWDDDDEQEWDDTFDWGNTSYDRPNDDNLREDLEAMKRVDRELGYGLGAKKRAHTNEIKNLLGQLGINVRKGDGPHTKSLLDRIQLMTDRRTGKISGAKFDGVKIIILEKGRFTFSKNVKFQPKIAEFNDLAEKAKEEHEKTAIGFLEEKNDKITVDDQTAKSVLNDSIEEVEERVSTIEENIVPLLTENEIREFRGILNVRLPTLEQQREGGITVEDRLDALKAEEDHWRELAGNENDPQKKLLYESVADVAKLKADELRLRVNLRPESEEVQSIVEEKTKSNALVRFQKFKNWAKKNLGGISIFAISVAGIITTIVMGARTVVKKGAKAASRFAKTLAKLAEKAGPVLGALFNLAAGLLKLGAKAVGFLSENLWILAVVITYALYDQKISSKGKK